MSGHHKQVVLDTERARINMVESQIKPGGVRDERVCRAILRVPREKFVSASQQAIAYADRQITMSAGGSQRELMMPHSFAKMAEAANVQPQDLVLDIGGGCGYSAAVFALLGATIIALEDVEEFSTKMADVFTDIGADNVVSVTGPLIDGQAKQGPYDVIFLNGRVEQLPQGLLAQLANGGRLVCVSYQDEAYRLTVVTRAEEQYLRHYGPVLAAPSLSAFNRVPEFEF